MTRIALAEELYNFIERYRHSTAALETFAESSLRNIDQNQSQMSYILERLHRGMHEESVASLAPDIVPTTFPVDILGTVAKAVSDYSRYFELHPQMLLEMGLTYAGALFDAFISDVLFAILRHIPEKLRSGRTLTAEEALRFRDRDELIEDLARREMPDLTYESAERQLDYFRKSFGVDLFAAR